MPGPALGELAGQPQPQDAEAAGDEIRGIGPNGGWQRLRRAAALQARDIPPRSPVGHLVLTVGNEELACEPFDLVLSRFGVEIDDASPEVGVLEGEDPGEAPKRSGGPSEGRERREIGCGGLA